MVSFGLVLGLGFELVLDYFINVHNLNSGGFVNMPPSPIPPSGPPSPPLRAAQGTSARHTAPAARAPVRARSLRGAGQGRRAARRDPRKRPTLKRVTRSAAVSRLTRVARCSSSSAALYVDAARPL